MPLMGKMIILGVLIFLVIVMAVVVFGLYLYSSGGKSKIFQINYDGSRKMYRGAITKCGAGNKVTVYFKQEWIATDTDYTFFVNGDAVNALFVKGKGMRISFVMPEHDVTVSYSSRNSMTFMDEYGE